MSCAMGNRPESKGWTKIYEFDNFKMDVTNFVYKVDNSLTAPAFTRVLFQIVADKFSVWVEMDDWTLGDATKIGVPLTWVYDNDVTNLVVWSSNPGTGFPNANQATIYSRKTSLGRLNFWPSNYGTGTNTVYDYEDTSYNTVNGHGSFQVFDMEPTTPECLFAWNHWGTSPSIGMGNWTGTHPDWTFSYQGNQFSKTLCRIYVK